MPRRGYYFPDDVERLHSAVVSEGDDMSKPDFTTTKEDLQQPADIRPRCSSCGRVLVRPRNAAGEVLPFWVCELDGAVSGCV